MKSKLTWISILLVLLFVGIQYWVTLQGHIKLPSSEWSRTTSLSEKKSDYSVIESVKEENGFTVTLKDLKKQDVFYCEEDFKGCSFERTVSEGLTYKTTYNDRKNTYYIKDNQLVFHSDSEEKVIAEAVDFTIGEDKIAYWTEDFQVVVINRNDLSEEYKFQMAEPIKIGTFKEENLFIITENQVKRIFTGYLANKEPEQLFSFNVKSSENLQSVKMIADKGEKYGILLDIEVMAGGGRSKTIYYSPFDLKKQELKLTKLKFVDKETDSRIDDIRFPYILESAEGNKIAFSGGAFDVSGEYAHRIFVGDFTPNEIKAMAATKSEESASRPHLVDGKNVLFFEIDGKEKSLAYASSEPVKVSESTHIGEGDFKAALFKLLTILMNGMVLLLVSFLWFLPALGLTYGIQYLFRKYNKPLSEQVLLYLHAAILIGSQIIIFTKVFYMEAFVARIPFLQDVWQLLLLLAVCMLISILPVLIVRKRVTEDNFNSTIMYVTAMNLLLLLILVGPYFL